MIDSILKVVEIAEERWHEHRQPRNRLVRSILVLRSSLVNCQEAYERWKKKRDLQSVQLWSTSLDSFLTTLANLEETLQVFDPALYQHLQHYVKSERRIHQLYHAPDALAMQSARELATLLGWDANAASANIPDEDFTPAIAQLDNFIRTNFKMEEMFGGS